MTREEAIRFNTLYNSLVRISNYQSPESIQHESETEEDGALGYQEMLEMAYDNVLQEATLAIKGIEPVEIVPGG